MSEFLQVFLDDLPRLPLNRKIGFIIYLMSSIEPISKALYKMTSIELKELKDTIVGAHW